MLLIIRRLEEDVQSLGTIFLLLRDKCTERPEGIYLLYDVALHHIDIIGSFVYTFIDNINLVYHFL